MSTDEIFVVVVRVIETKSNKIFNDCFTLRFCNKLNDSIWAWVLVVIYLQTSRPLKILSECQSSFTGNNIQERKYPRKKI